MGKIVKLSPKKTKPKYKYALNAELAKLPRSTSINDVIKHLAKYGITRDEFYRDREIAFGSDSSIPSDRLFIYAQVLDCMVDDLMNQQPKAQSIRQTNSRTKTNSPLS